MTIRDVMRRLMEHRETLKISGTKLKLMSNTVRTLDAIISRGVITPGERNGVVQVARLVLATVL